MNLKPFTKWVGGKTKLLPELKEIVPINYNRYYEPFIGGGALFFSLQPKIATINDMNQELVNVYRVIKEQPTQLLALLQQHQEKNSKEYFLKIRSLDRIAEPAYTIGGVERAARILYLLKTDFNGLYRVNSKGQFNAPYGRYKNPKIANKDNILAISKYLNTAQIKILSGDFQKAVQTAGFHDLIYF